MVDISNKSISESRNFQLHHLGYATSSIDTSFEIFSPVLVSQKPVLSHTDREQNVNVEFYNLKDNLLIEFISPLNEKSPINNFLKANPNGAFHHLAYECKNYSSGLGEMKEKGFKRITAETIGFENRKIAFFLPKKNLTAPLIEIISTKP